MILHLGVNDVVYEDPEAKGSVTTGEVGAILEDKYHVMRVFYETYQRKIAEAVAAEMQVRLDSLMEGNQDAMNGEVMIDRIHAMFSNYLDLDEWQQITGQVIMAAQGGANLRKKSKKSNARPAFIDTGTYQRSMRAWLDDDES